jgi:hypothetical protein
VGPWMWMPVTAAAVAVAGAAIQVARSELGVRKQQKMKPRIAANLEASAISDGLNIGGLA